MSVGFCIAAITFAAVNVLPDPVTPSSTWCFFFSTMPLQSASMALGWSPCGANSLTSSKS